MKTFARERDRIEILRRLGNLQPDSARQWGRMSVSQMVCHLSDSCRMALGRKAVSRASGLPQRTLVKWMALYLPLPWPQGTLLTRPEVEQGLGGTCPGDFACDVAELAGLLQELAEPRTGGRWPEHPIFGRMSDWEWRRWAYLHADHHLRQFGV